MYACSHNDLIKGGKKWLPGGQGLILSDSCQQGTSRIQQLSLPDEVNELGTTQATSKHNLGNNCPSSLSSGPLLRHLHTCDNLMMAMREI